MRRYRRNDVRKHLQTDVADAHELANETAYFAYNRSKVTVMNMDGIAPTEHDIYLFHEGSLHYSYRMLGAHLSSTGNGVRFTAWAPHAKQVAVVGNFNGWNSRTHMLERMDRSGLWSLWVPGLREGEVYKFAITDLWGVERLKSDPYAFYAELRPATASVVARLDGYAWRDGDWLRKRRSANALHRPLHIYEVHPGSWRVGGAGEHYSYERLSAELIDYALDLGFTHLELLPLAEHPFDRSWGYQITCFYAVTSRFGTPEQFKHFVDECHLRGLGVIMDWVPGHFCKDDHGLRLFDGTPQFEYADERRAEKREWGTLAFDLGKPEVISFLISNALFWFEQYHIDGLRVDAVASMLYLNFGRDSAELVNERGGPENLQAVAFFRKLNETVFAHYPDALMMAEDSTDWPLVCAPTDKGGLGFNFKWNMGWMNDTLRYMQLDPLERGKHHGLLTFSLMYAFAENYVLPFSHDEVVHGKKSLLDKMPGDYWHKFAGLRLLYGYMIAHPGKKLLFMGGEFGQFAEWRDGEGEQLDWQLLEYDMHRRMQQYVRELGRFYRSQPALWELDHEQDGFEWIDPNDEKQSILTFMRKTRRPRDTLLAVCNFTPMTYAHYRIGVPFAGLYTERFNSDHVEFGGSGHVQAAAVRAEKVPWHGRDFSIAVRVPPYAIALFAWSSR